MAPVAGYESEQTGYLGKEWLPVGWRPAVIQSDCVRMPKAIAESAFATAGRTGYIYPPHWPWEGASVVWFVIGAIIASIQLTVSLHRSGQREGHYGQAYLFAAVAGAAVYGTVLWLVFG